MWFFSNWNDTQKDWAGRTRSIIVPKWPMLSYGKEELTCGNGEFIDLAVVDKLDWYSPGWLDGDHYPSNKKYVVLFIPYREVLNLFIGTDYRCKKTISGAK